jgi:bifunctional non-homologous end joining protein LigD
MSLGEYNRKRDFQKTAEPPGRAGSSATGRSFVIQKHAATRLHYDFRLELDGALKSWSVPKGPSLDPAAKRLAVAVEDHPIDYGGFEGIIPKGQYGGGTVLLWDRGTWSPVGDAAASLAAGHLKFDLEGEKLHGRWALVRLKPRPGRRGGDDDRSWLLVKDRDGYARPEAEWNVTEARPESVVTGRDLPAIAAATDSVWHSNRGRADPGELPGAKKVPLPARLVPARIARVRAVPAGDDWLHEVEIAGARVEVRISAGRVRLLAPGGEDRSDDLAPLVQAARALPANEALIDGVVTALGADGKTRADAPPDVLYLVDLPFLDGYDLRGTPLVERKRALAAVLAGAGTAPALRFADHVVGGGRETFAAACQLGALGIVSKRADAPYRSASKSAAPPARVVRCPTSTAQPGALVRNGRAGPTSGPAAKREGTAKAAKTTEATKPAQAKPAQAKPAQAKPAQAATAPVQTAPSPAEAAKAREIRVAGVKLTHPERVLYTDAGLTKLDLARYYEDVARFMVPFVEDRPLTLVRSPDGFGGQTFYVRHAGVWAPKELRQFEIKSGTGSGTTMIADNLAGLVALAQMNVLEIHAWNARTSHLEAPDRIVFDLDPGPRVPWSAVVEGALRVRAVLEQLDLASFVKTTGSKGLHVLVPLSPEAPWADTLAFSHDIALALARSEPSRYSADLAKAGREDKIFIDYLRNRRGATSVSIYSTRARPMATVSIPVAWDALGSGTPSDGFHVGDRAGWLGRRKTDPWADYHRTRQRLQSRHLAAARAVVADLGRHHRARR